MTTNSSTDTWGKWSGIACQAVSTISPTWFNRITPSATSPKRQARSRVQIVTKYTPARV